MKGLTWLNAEISEAEVVKHKLSNVKHLINSFIFSNHFHGQGCSRSLAYHGSTGCEVGIHSLGDYAHTLFHTYGRFRVF